MRRIGVSTSVIRSDFRLINYYIRKFNFANLFEFGFINPMYVHNIYVLKNKSIGVHSPFVFKLNGHPMLTRSNYFETYSKILKSAYFAKNIGAEYLIVHYPDTLQNEDWKGNEILLYELNKIIKIRLENTYGNKFFYSEVDYKRICGNLNLKLCVDIGHLMLDDRINPIKFIDTLSDYIEEFHIYFANKLTYNLCHHKPWENDKNYLDLLEYIKNFEADLVIETTPECGENLDKLLNFLGVL